MKNFIKQGAVIGVIAPAALASGEGVLVGSIFGVAQADAESGAEVQIVRHGVFELAKTSAQAWTVGVKLYWDDTNKVVTTVDTDNTLIGTAHAAAANPSSTGEVLLDGAAR